MINKSTVGDEKQGRNVRDPVFKAKCIETISGFLTKNKYEGNIALNNPSTKDFQNILRFIVAFVDAEMSSKFEEDVIFLIKALKYPYANEITKSQLSSITPHALPALLSMLAWLTELVTEALPETDSRNMDAEFFDCCLKGYANFMENTEEGEVDDEFLENVREMYNKDNYEVENIKGENDMLENELNDLKEKFNELHVLEAKKTKQLNELNNLVHQDKQIEQKKEKYVSAIETILENVKDIQERVDRLVEEKNELNGVVSAQEINMDDLNELTDEKTRLVTELDTIKNERDAKMRSLSAKDAQFSATKTEISKVLNEIINMRNIAHGEFTESVDQHENLVIKSREELVKQELLLKELEDKFDELKTAAEDIEKKYARMESNLKETGAVYLSKKEIFDKNYEESLNKMDQQTRDMLNLKLASDYLVQNSERELNNSKIDLDSTKSRIGADKDFIEKHMMDLCEFIDTNQNTLNNLIKELTNFNK